MTYADWITVVTASTNPRRTAPAYRTWHSHRGPRGFHLVHVLNGDFVRHLQGPKLDADLVIGEPGHFMSGDRMLLCKEYLGPVPAFELGVAAALTNTDAQYIACLHDDVEIRDSDWVEKVIAFFTEHPKAGLVGFGGAMGVGRAGMYEDDFDPFTLARHHFGSDLMQWKAHGERWTVKRQVAVLDGFSMIFRREFLEGARLEENPISGKVTLVPNSRGRSLFSQLTDMGVVHHAYDGAMGCYAKRLGWETWFLPIHAHHWGGTSAVGDAGYQAWAREKHTEGDQGFWKEAHRIVYDEFRTELPFTVIDRPEQTIETLPPAEEGTITEDEETGLEELDTEEPSDG